MNRNKPKAKSTPKKGATNKSAPITSASGTKRASETASIDPFRKPKPRKGRKGTRYHMYYWFEQQIMRLPKGKLKKDFQEWLKDPDNGLIW